MTVAETVSHDGARLRLRPWRGRDDVAELTAVVPGSVRSPAQVRVAVERAGAVGYRRVVTPAIPDAELRPYLDCGFAVQERLHLLTHSLIGLPSLDRSLRLRRALSRDLDGVLAVDRQAFQPFWRLDETALRDALHATPSTRYRVDRSEAIAGYAITGRSGQRGYVQRLAVDPAAQGRGLGRALLLDGLHWLRRWRVREALVNTQEANQRALDLYHRTGFRRRRDGLSVVRLDLG